MRMSQHGLTAEDIVNSYSTEQLVYILRTFGEERFAKKIALSIVKRRETQLFTETADLAEHIKKIVPFQRIHPATRTFQALRIAVNNELDEIQCAIDQGLTLLKDQGLLIVITFHSLEHKVVKNALQQYVNTPPAISRYAAPKVHEFTKPFMINYIKKCAKPSDAEVLENVRARSAQMRICQKQTL